jgi:CDP-paratose 2-epimerase
MKYLITGGCGFLGSNIAAELLRKKVTLTILDNLSRTGSQKNLAWLREINPFDFVRGDIRDTNLVSRLVAELQPDIIFHFAGQVAMTVSITNPRYDFEVNALGTLNILEAVRQNSPHSAIIYSSTNKVYGDLASHEYYASDSRYVMNEFPNGLPESIPLQFHSPYGCSKGCADQYMLDYSRIYGLTTVVFRHSSMYGARQFPSYDQGWIGWFCQQALIQKLDDNNCFTISGNGKQVRDVLHCDDIVQLYIKATECLSALRGEAFNIGGGIDNSLSVLELIYYIENVLNKKLRYKFISTRASDQLFFVADLQKLKDLINWNPSISYKSGIVETLRWLKNCVK